MGCCGQSSDQPAIVQAAQTVAHGAVGIVKYVTRTGLAKSAVIAVRRDACAGCDQNALGFCKQCKCWLNAKTSLLQEKCPLDKWKTF